MSQTEPSEEEKKKMYDSLPAEHREKQTYTEWVKEGYNNQYNKWMPWLEDQYLAWFGKDNKASYATKEYLDKGKVTNIDQVNQLQDGVNGLVSGQVGKGGLLQPVGDMASKEGINRAERQGKDDSGSYGGPVAGYTDPMLNAGKSTGETVSSGASSAVGSIAGGAKSAGGYVGSMLGSKGEGEGSK